MPVKQGRLAPNRSLDLPLSQELVAAVAYHLDSEGVPNVLWGNYLLTAFGVPSIVAVRYSFPLCLVEITDLSLGRRVRRARLRHLRRWGCSVQCRTQALRGSRLCHGDADYNTSRARRAFSSQNRHLYLSSSAIANNVQYLGLQHSAHNCRSRSGPHLRLRPKSAQGKNGLR